MIGPVTKDVWREHTGSLSWCRRGLVRGVVILGDTVSFEISRRLLKWGGEIMLTFAYSLEPSSCSITALVSKGATSEALGGRTRAQQAPNDGIVKKCAAWNRSGRYLQPTG